MKTFSILIKVLLVLVGSLPCAISSCDPEPYPPKLLECLRTMEMKADIRTIAGELVSTYCVRQLLWNTTGTQINLNPREEQTLISAFNNPPAQVTYDSQGRRVKRSDSHLRVRKEYRTLTDEERAKFHAAVNKMKYNTDSLLPNVYDFMANLHSGTEMANCHGGANFLGWHRVFLVLFENLLLQEDPSVVFPYWDCRLDAENGDQAQNSYLFSDDFLGEGEGMVSSGPFREWNLQRNVAQTGLLITYNDVDQLMTYNKIEDVVYPTAPGWDSFLEGKHGGIHSYVGGQLGQLTTAGQEPAFFLLHNFIDYIWEQFRSKLTDPEHYPDKLQQDKQLSNATMPIFTTFQNSHGYLNVWTEKVYRYADPPTCENNCGDSKWLECNYTSNRCRAKLIGEPLATTEKKKRSTWNLSDLRDIWSCPQLRCPKVVPIQNTFEINGVPNAQNWDYIPVEVIYKRPPGIQFNSYRIIYNYVDNSSDIFGEDNLLQRSFAAVHNSIGYGMAGILRDCRVNPSGSTRVFVNVHGLSYEGLSSDYAIVDARLPVSSGIAYVPIKSPHSDVTETTRVLIEAFDECGRLCHPMCRDSTKFPPTYKMCSGVITLRTGGIHFCESSVLRAVNNIWDVPVGNGNPLARDDTICVKFVCDAKSVYPWDKK